MIRTYEISYLYQLAFGYRGLPFPYKPPPHGVRQADQFSGPEYQELVEAQDFSITGDMPADAASGKYAENLPFTRSLAGAPLYMPTGFSVGGSIVQLPNEPILTCSIRKNIVETTLAGNTRRGTVKEIINTEDWRIRIQGLCIDVTKQGYPEEEVEAIQQLYEHNRSIEIINYMLNNIFGIKNVVMRDLRWRGMEGRPYSQAYELELVSDEDFLLIIG
ncbi:MAG TPA: hypothetical protein ENN08_06685 [Bacteroidales bacterium]|nr:hypothetical protein [Bacteroidales bacterium]